MQTDNNPWTQDYDEVYNPHVHRKRPFNKERYCRKNKLTGGKYGEHQYNNGRCKLCSKIDPQRKRKVFEEIKNDRSSIKA